MIQPEGVRRIESSETNSPTWASVNDEDFLKNWVFCYNYDHRDRMTEKRVPGSDWMYMVYDTRDRLVATQDGNQRTEDVDDIDGNKDVDRYQGKSYKLNSGGRLALKQGFRYKYTGGKRFAATDDAVAEDKVWIYTKYDALDRPVATGFYHDNSDRQTLQNQVDDPQYTFSESFTGTGALQGYTNTTFPDASPADQLTVTYYDEYGFGTGLTFPAGTEPVVKGQATGSRTKVMKTGQWLETITFYDKRYRQLKVSTDNHKNGKDIVENYYRNDVSGLISRAVNTHTSDDYTGSLVVEDIMTYDHMDRLKKHDQSINGGANVTIADNNYNDLGELVSKHLGDSAQIVDYEYNIQGWLTKINEGAVLTGTDKFGMELQYEVAGQYNGNIGRMLWQSIGGNGVNEALQQYDYTYDPMSRLKTAVYSTDDTNTSIGGFSVEGITYDANGNIRNLTRYRDFGGLKKQIDNLTYQYTVAGQTTGHSNRLLSVTDNGDTGSVTDPANDKIAKYNDYGFLDGNTSGDDYAYDANGNMISDENKEITWIGYNYLNLPEEVQFANGDYVKYIYDAAGIKLQKEARLKVSETEFSVTVTDYIGGKHYKDGALEFFQHAEGRVRLNGGTFSYEYNLTDHLGNVRVTVDQSGTVIQKDDYYPFGLTFNHWNTGEENNYKFNGNEVQVEIPNVADFNARFYDNSLGRFMTSDPLADHPNQFNQSPYQFSWNNPTNLNDPSGECPFCPWQNWWTIVNVVGENHKYGTAGVIWDQIVDASPAGTMKRTANAASNYISNEVDYGLNRGNQIEGAIARNEDPNQVSEDYETRKAFAQFELLGVGVEWTMLSTGGAMASVEGALLTTVTRNTLKSLVSQYATYERNSLSTITQKSKFNTASVAFDKTTGKLYFGRNKGIRRSGMNTHNKLQQYYPEESINDYLLGNCAECDAVNRALHDGADWANLQIETVGIDKNGVVFSKTKCQNCNYIFDSVQN